MKMQMPSNTSAGNEPFIMKNGMLSMPQMNNMIPIEHQVPAARQYNLSITADIMDFDALLKKTFKKEAIIWMMDHNWSKEGECNVMVLYCDIVKPEKKPDEDVSSVGKINPKIVKNDKIDEMFGLFDDVLKDIDEIQENENLDLEMEDEEEDDE